jgi:uncharacterized membrane protein
MSLERELVKEVIGRTTPIGEEEKLRATNLKKKFETAIRRGEADPKVNSLISATSNDAKAAVLVSIGDGMSDDEYRKFANDMVREKVISLAVVTKARILKNKK